MLRCLRATALAFAFVLVSLPAVFPGDSARAADEGGGQGKEKKRVEKPSKAKAATFAFNELYFLPLRIHVLQSEALKDEIHSRLSADDIQRRVDGVQRIWAQAGVRIYVESVVREAAVSESRFEKAKDARGRRPLDAFRWLCPPKTRARDALDCYLLRQLPVNGVYFGGEPCLFVKDEPSLRPVPGGTDFASERVFSHEIGHFLGLRHYRNRNLLMASGTSGFRIDAEMTSIARRVAERRPRASSARELIERAKSNLAGGKEKRAHSLLTVLTRAPGTSKIKDEAKKLLGAAGNRRKTPGKN